jgi:hypothetical protein
VGLYIGKREHRFAIGLALRVCTAKTRVTKAGGCYVDVGPKDSQTNCQWSKQNPPRKGMYGEGVTMQGLWKGQLQCL